MTSLVGALTPITGPSRRSSATSATSRSSFRSGSTPWWPSTSRAEVLTLLRSLSSAQWERGGIHLSLGRLTLADWVASLAGHDDNHLDQLRRALDGRP